MTHQELQQLQQKLELKEQSLIEREANHEIFRKWASEKELEVHSKEMKEKTLDATFLVKENQLRQLNSKLEDLNTSITDNELVLDKIRADTEEAKRLHGYKKLELKHELETVKNDTSKAKSALNIVLSETTERETYLKHQELSIEEASQAGNNKILDLKDNVGDLQSRVDELKIEEINAKKLSDERTFNTMLLESDLSARTERFEEKLQSIEGEITIREKFLATLEDDIQNANSTSQKHEQALKERELSIGAKLDQISRERQEFETDKRRWSGRVLD